MEIIKRNVIRIPINERSNYDCVVLGIDTPNKQEFKKMYWWLNHLEENDWWARYNEPQFIRYCHQIYG
jgi:hypothetical protein